MNVRKVRGCLSEGQPFIKNSVAIFSFLLFSFTSYAQKSHVFIDWKMGECVACQGSVNEYLKSALKRDTLFVLLPEKYRPEENMIREALPLLSHPQVKVVWSDALRKRLGEEMVSYLYHLDIEGKIIAKAPLKGLPPEAFVPLDLSSKNAVALATITNVLSEKSTTEQYTELNKESIDTLHFEGSFPLDPTDFDLSESYIAVADRLTNGMFYYDRKIPNDTAHWNVLKAQMLRPSTYKKYFKTSSTNQIKALEDSLDKRTAITGFGSNGSITGINVQGNSIYFFVKYLYLGHFSLNNILALYKLRSGTYEGPWFEHSYFKKANDSLWNSTFENAVIPPASTQEDSNRIERALTTQYNDLFKKLIQQSGLKFTMSEDACVYLGKGKFALRVTSSDSVNYQLLAYYKQDDTSLQPIGLVPLKKPKLWRENNLGLNMTSLTGHYPYYMIPIANTLYDLKNEQAVDLPISLGDYDYSPDAMRIYKPRTGMFVQDVVGDDRFLKVLYSVKEKTERSHRLYLLYYDLVSRKVLSQKEYLPGGVPFDEDTRYRFDGLKRIAALRQDCRCIVFYPAP